MSHSVYNSSVPKRKGKKLLDLKKFKMHLPNKTIQATLLEKRWGNHEAWKKGMTSLSPPWPGNASWTNQKKRHSLAPKSRKKSTITAFTSSHLLLYKLISVIIVKFLHKLKEYIYNHDKQPPWTFLPTCSPRVSGCCWACTPLAPRQAAQAPAPASAPWVRRPRLLQPGNHGSMDQPLGHLAIDPMNFV